MQTRVHFEAARLNVLTHPASGTTDLSWPTLTSRFAFAAALAALGLFATFMLTGTGQDPLQYVNTPEDYKAILLRDSQTLRLTIGLDNVFVAFYSTAFLALAATLWRGMRSSVAIAASTGLLGLTALLDLLENMHFLTMIAAALKGIAITQQQIELQVWESLLKFHVSYLGLFLLSFALPNETPLERALCFALRWVQLPVGLLIYLTPASIAFPLIIVRFSFFLFALTALGCVFRRHRSYSDAPG
jgi:hypothetical protein